MKSTDLMEGDFVSHLGQIFEITKIDGPHIYMKSSDGDSEDQHIRSIEPIEITPKILENNNFQFLEDKRIYYNLEFALHPYGFRKYAPYRVGDTTIFINYVHELQHLLKLCNKKFKYIN